MKKKILLFILALSPVSTMAELSVEGLDLRLKGVGYRWVQDFESGEDKSITWMERLELRELRNKLERMKRKLEFQ